MALSGSLYYMEYFEKQEWDTFSVVVKETKHWLGDKEKLVPTWKQVTEKFIPP